MEDRGAEKISLIVHKLGKSLGVIFGGSIEQPKAFAYRGERYLIPAKDGKNMKLFVYQEQSTQLYKASLQGWHVTAAQLKSRCLARAERDLLEKTSEQWNDLLEVRTRQLKSVRTL